MHAQALADALQLGIDEHFGCGRTATTLGSRCRLLRFVTDAVLAAVLLARLTRHAAFALAAVGRCTAVAFAAAVLGLGRLVAALLAYFFAAFFSIFGTLAVLLFACFGLFLLALFS